MSKAPAPRRLASRAVTSAAQSLPDAVVRRALVAASRLGAGPTIGPPPGRQVLVVAPHPDDESLVAGGTIHTLTRRGVEVTLALATAGEGSRAPGTSASIGSARTREARQAADVLGIRTVREFGLPDGGLDDHLDDLAHALTDVMAQHPPDVVITTWFGDGHRDHVAVNRALSTLASDHGDVPVWGGEMWTPLPATNLVDLDAEAQAAKEAAVACHVTAARVFDLSARLALDRFRSTNGLRGRGSAEAYLVLPLRDLAAALARLDEFDDLDE